MITLKRDWPIAGLLIFLVVCASFIAHGQGQNFPGSLAPGANAIGTVGITNTPGTTDPCDNPSILKSSVVINIASATTTSLVSVSGTKAVYVCGMTVTIDEPGTSASTLQLEYGTGAACSSPTVLTGSFGAGAVVTSPVDIAISLADPATSVVAPSANGVCAVTVGSQAVNVQGVLEYVQQ